jgi:hypothetical protein
MAGSPATAAADGAPCCGRCGSPELRRSQSRHALDRLARRFTPWVRYACRVCGHRGWARGPLGPRLPPPGAPDLAAARRETPTGRHPEVRDHRLRQRMRTRAVVLVALSLLLGVVAALSMQRCGLPGPPGE